MKRKVRNNFTEKKTVINYYTKVDSIDIVNNN